MLQLVLTVLRSLWLLPVKQKCVHVSAASAGLGLKFNINTKWAIDVEARGAIAPSIFGNISSHRKAEGTGMLTAGVSYIFGGKKFIPVSKIDEDAVNAEINRYRSELAQAQADLANCKNALANAKPEVKEVTKEVEVAGPRAIFFKIGSAVWTTMARLTSNWLPRF